MPVMQVPKQYLCRVGPLLGSEWGVFVLEGGPSYQGNVGVYQTHTPDRLSAHLVDHNNQTATHALPNCQKNQEKWQFDRSWRAKNIEQR